MTRSADRNMELLASMIDGIGIAMLVTRSCDGHFVSRPVATLDAPFAGDLWFFTSAASHKAGEIKAHPQVNLAYAAPDRNTYVSIAGHASVRRDRARIAALWNDAMRTYFPGGPDDPDLTLVRVRVETAEYWDGPGTIAGKALSFVLGAAAGDPDLMGDNRTLRIDPDKSKAKVVRGNTRGDAARRQRAAARGDAGRPAAAKASRDKRHGR